ncbi:ABC transporter ATP-binding protein [Marinomonas mediterranea]|jgi:ABC-type antimicrobial peptide transport system, ATPase component|uniref:Polyamine-transporting ATPase n=1 Tax=Marinomonas mediterranea (strain ATCC 700492 / JCM 21426 / NBRC 103028 / MMB-1) TaxID=717774 RepID=F2K2V3_MARM1|nr:ABC transporter ATP-binding protein [Marinomonas mediterranea]ADZ91236.1 Polyamine-transporting ATPase [Marinomonas mediterranea MMB-1]WCN09210.1 ATP-binding cassette domain-containing protein [Marinomonas mediterranea]WCN13293.1 ATP-binding cassette domain-containing protein [Marinomonas mediterranea]WCN17361.1 ATP-binding cassette domain-containing protein [Marinomonas mediterranea MMB-1]
MNNAVLECANLSKTYLDGKREVDVLQGINFSIESGQAFAIVGSSGSGKTTLLNLLAGLDSPTDGEVRIEGTSWYSLKDAKRSKLRNTSMGFVYQFHHLLPEFSALENVMMPLNISGMKSSLARDKALEVIGRVGLADRSGHRPGQLSGGERQRIAIARALVTQPACVLMDEPTGNLDETTSKEIQALIGELKEELGMAFIVVTHDERMLSWMDGAYRLSNGELNEI